MFAERYGYTIKEFYALTLRQVFQIKRAMEKRLQQQREWDAALQGKKLQNQPKPLDITYAEEKEYDDKAKGLLEKMKREHEQRSRTTHKN